MLAVQLHLDIFGSPGHTVDRFINLTMLPYCMVKNITIRVDDEEYDVWIEKKGVRTWEDVLRQGLEVNKEES